VTAGLLARRERHVAAETLTAGLVRDLRRRGADIEEDVAVRAARAHGRRLGGGAPAAARCAPIASWSPPVSGRRALVERSGRPPLEGAKGYSVTRAHRSPARRGRST